MNARRKTLRKEPRKIRRKIPRKKRRKAPARQQWFQLDIRRSEVHGFGLFAGESIPWGKKVIEYTGEKIGEKEFWRRERFYNSIGYNPLFALDKKTTIDGLIGGNASIFINHSKTPNLGVLREDGRIFFFSLEDIAKGRELTFEYGYDV